MAAALAIVGAAPADAGTVEVQRRELIESIAIDPQRPCRGQSVSVRVKLRPDGREAKVSIAGNAGTAAVLRFERRGRRRIGIVARDWSDGMQIERRRIDVADCRVEEPALQVERLGDGRVALRLVAAPHARDARGYRWLLGDGSLVTTREPFLVHDYSLAGHVGAAASWLVQVQPVDTHALPAREAVTLDNPWWLASRSGTLWLRTRAAAFAARLSDEDAPIVRMQIAGDGAVSGIERVSVRGFACADLDRSLAAELPAAVLSRQTLEKSGWTDLEIAVPPATWSEPVCRVEVRLHGQTADGRPAVALGAAELGVASARRRVTDPALLQRLRQAKMMLGRSQVSEADLRLLAARGESASTQ